MRGGSAGSAERSRTLPRERGRRSTTSISKIGGSPRGSDSQSIRSGASSLDVAELWNVASRWRIGAVAGRPAIAAVDVHARVVGEVRADPGQIEPDRDPERAQVLGRSDARAHQDRRAPVGPGAEHDPARFDDGAVEEPDACGARVPSNTTSATCASGSDRQVGRRAADREIGVGRRDANAVRVSSSASVRRPRRRAGCGPPPAGSRPPSSASSPAAAISVSSSVEVASDRHRAIVAVPRPIAEIGVGLEPPEVREHVLEAPARIAERRPLVVVGRGAPQREPRHP